MTANVRANIIGLWGESRKQLTMPRSVADA
jgi:hypothetical protein